MVRIWSLIILLILITGAAINCSPSIACDDSLPPILDTNVDNNLHLKQIDKTDIAPNLTCIEEYWVKGKKSSVRIQRWVFKNAKEIDKFVQGYGGLTNGFNIPQWDKSAEFGDKTYWMEPGMVVFAKGKILVKIFAYDEEISPNLEKEYTRKIAKSIAKKL